ncbi:MAG TPA: restriction endonuclease subunit S [Ignavibacteria bacterium]
MNNTELKDIISISKGKKVDDFFPEKSDGSIRFIQIDDLRNDNNLKYTFDKTGIEVKEKDLIIAWDGANAGTIGYGLKGIIGSTLARLIIIDDQIYYRYLGKLLQNKFKYLRSRCTGATIPHISKNVLENLQIPFPSLEVQKQIADTLDKADALRQKRKQSIQLLGDYLKSVFYDMFGDPVINNKKWNLAKFSDVGTLDRGRSKHRPRNAPHLLGGKYPLIQTGDIANSKGYIRFFSQTYSDEGLKQSKMWKKGTLCITIAANIAKTGILTFDACFPDSVVGFIPNSKTNVEYIQYWLSYLQKRLEDTAPESAQKNINLEILRKLIVPIPPILLQNKFAQIVAQVEQTKSKMEESLKKIDNLFNSLMNKFFGK